MKKLLTFSLLIIIAANTNAQNSYGALGDTLLYLHSAANTNYTGVTMKKIEVPAGAAYYELPSMLGADRVICYHTNDHGLQMNLSYNRNNPSVKKIKKGLFAFYDAIAKDGIHHINRSYEQNVSIEENGRDIINYMLALDKDDKEVLNIYVYQTLPVLTDESVYKSNFPTTVTNSGKPQVWQMKGSAGPGSYERYNGIFKDGRLIKGNKVIHGYGPYYDGTWFSEEWILSQDYGSVEIVFYPEGTTDKVYGRLNHAGDLEAYYPDQRYNSSAKHAYSGLDPKSPAWLLKAYVPHMMAEYEAQQIANSSSSSNSGTYSQRDYNNTSSNNSSRSSQPIHVARERTCTACGGHGRVVITDSYGHSTTGFCSVCNGTGKVTY